MSPFDAFLFRRALAAMFVLAALATGIVVGTDEPTSTVGMRAARLAALEPLVAAVAVLAIVAHARSRGEIAALAALGASPRRAARGAVLASGVFALVAVAVLCSRWVDVKSLFPTVHSALAWTVDPEGRFASAEAVFAAANGRLMLAADTGSVHHVVERGARDALPCLAPLGFTVGPWAATPMSAWTRAASLFAAGALAVFGLHLVAAERLPAIGGGLAIVPLLFAIALTRKAR